MPEVAPVPETAAAGAVKRRAAVAQQPGRRQLQRVPAPPAERPSVPETVTCVILAPGAEAEAVEVEVALVMMMVVDASWS